VDRRLFLNKRTAHTQDNQTFTAHASARQTKVRFSQTQTGNTQLEQCRCRRYVINNIRSFWRRHARCTSVDSLNYSPVKHDAKIMTDRPVKVSTTQLFAFKQYAMQSRFCQSGPDDVPLPLGALRPFCSHT
jgi:hypothetical protein